MKKSILYIVLFAIHLNCFAQDKAQRNVELENTMVNSPTIILGIFTIAMNEIVTEKLQDSFKETLPKAIAENNASALTKDLYAVLGDVSASIIKVKKSYEENIDSLKQHDSKNFEKLLQLEAFDKVLKTAKTYDLKGVFPNLTEEVSNEQFIQIISYMIIADKLDEGTVNKNIVDAYMKTIESYNEVLNNLKEDEKFGSVVKPLTIF